MHRIEEVVGKRRGQLVTQRVPTDTSAIGLVEPLAELVSVTSGASALDLATFSLDDDEAPAVLSGRFPAGSVVTYRCPAAVPADVELATMHLAVTWFRQDNVGPPGQRASGSDGDVLQGFAMPRRVSEMIRPYARTGFA